MAGASVQTGGMGWLGRRWAGLLGILLVALILSLHIAGSRLTPFGYPYAVLVAAAWRAPLLWAVRYLAVRLWGR
jgi:hypothetical protein